MLTTITIRGVDRDDLYDVLSALHKGSFEFAGPGVTVEASETGPRQVRNAAQVLDHLAGLIERRRIEQRLCPADGSSIGGDDLCPNDGCIHSRPRLGHPFGVVPA